MLEDTKPSEIVKCKLNGSRICFKLKFCWINWIVHTHWLGAYSTYDPNVAICIIGKSVCIGMLFRMFASDLFSFVNVIHFGFKPLSVFLNHFYHNRYLLRLLAVVFFAINLFLSANHWSL